MTKHYVDYSSLHEKQQKALQKAREILTGRGVIFPLPDYSLTPQENYDRFQAYSQVEANLIVELLKEQTVPIPNDASKPTEPKPIAWTGYND